MISLGGGDQSFWSGTGREIYYRHGSEVVAATVAPGDPFQIRNRQVLFDRPDDVVNAATRDYDATSSGSKFVFVTRPGERRIVVTLGALSVK